MMNKTNELQQDKEYMVGPHLEGRTGSEEGSLKVEWHCSAKGKGGNANSCSCCTTHLGMHHSYLVKAAGSKCTLKQKSSETIYPL